MSVSVTTPDELLPADHRTVELDPASGSVREYLEPASSQSFEFSEPSDALNCEPIDSAKNVGGVKLVRTLADGERDREAVLVVVGRAQVPRPRHDAADVLRYPPYVADRARDQGGVCVWRPHVRPRLAGRNGVLRNAEGRVVNERRDRGSRCPPDDLVSEVDEVLVVVSERHRGATVGFRERVGHRPLRSALEVPRVALRAVPELVGNEPLAVHVHFVAGRGRRQDDGLCVVRDRVGEGRWDSARVVPEHHEAHRHGHGRWQDGQRGAARAGSLE